MDGRLALSRRPQDGRTAGTMLPLTERMLGRLPGPRLAWGADLGGGPVTAALLPGSYLATVGGEPIRVRLLAGLVYAYAIALAVWAVGRFTSHSTTVQRSITNWRPTPEQAATPVFRGMTSLGGPLALTLVFTAVTVWRTAVLGDPWTAVLWLPVSFLVNLR